MTGASPSFHTVWAERGEVYLYRKRHDDLSDHGDSICPNGVARLAQIAGIRAQIGYKRRPLGYDNTPAVVGDTTLGRTFNIEAADKVWVTDITHIRRKEGSACLAGDRSLLPARDGMVGAKQADN